jgi:glycine/D-amino acid oxidase-like deaminating enzyme
MRLQSGYPFSLIRYGLPYSYPKLEQSVHAEVVIIGGGISGALTAHHLHKAGMECIVVDGRTIGLGSTCASTSLIQYEIDVPLSKLVTLIGEKNATAAYRDCNDAIFKLHDVCTSTGFRGFDFNKSLYFAARKKDISFLKKEMALRKQIGLEVEWLEESDVEDRFSLHAPGAILSKNAGYTDAYLLTHHLLQSGMKTGFVFTTEHLSRQLNFIKGAQHSLPPRSSLLKRAM